MTRAAWGGALALLAAIGILGEFRSPINGDVAYVLDIARRMLRGERLYLDLIDLNPPFIFWISQPAVLAGRLGVDPALAFRVLILVILSSSLLLASTIQRDGRAMPAGYVLAAFLLPVVHYGEREHLMLGLLLFYGAGFAAPAALHNATHDTRHALGLPCH